MAAEILLSGEARLEVAPGFELVYRYQKGDGPLRIFLNGLGDAWTSWDPFVNELSGLHLLQVDLRGQGRSLTEPQLAAPASHLRFPFETHSFDLHHLLDELGVKDPVRLIGYSYGGGIALDFASRWPERVERVALIAPFVIRLDRAFPAQRLCSFQWKMARSLGVLPNSVADHVEKSYENFLSHYMNNRYSKRMGDDRSRAVAVELTHEIMKFNALHILDKLPNESVFLLTSEFDTLSPHSLYREFWRRLPEAKRGHWLPLKEGEHLLLEEVPTQVLTWLREAIG